MFIFIFYFLTFLTFLFPSSVQDDEIVCYQSSINSIAKLSDSKYFIATTNSFYYILNDGQLVTKQNAKPISSINSNWNRIDAALMFSPEVCQSEFANKLLLLYYEQNQTIPQAILGSFVNDLGNQLLWSEPLPADNLTLFNGFDWSVRIDSIAYFYDDVFVFTGMILLIIINS